MTVAAPPPPQWAPATIEGSNILCTVTSGTGLFLSSGQYAFQPSNFFSNTYQILYEPGDRFGEVGTYAWTVTGNTTATLAFDDQFLGSGISDELVFTRPGAGTFTITQTGSGATQAGSFEFK